MWQDVAALTPPLVMCAAFIIGVVVFLRRQMGPKARPNACLPPPIARTAVLIFPERRVYAEPVEGAELPVRPDLLREVVLTMHRYLITESY